jgi:hypothetical protein
MIAPHYERIVNEVTEVSPGAVAPGLTKKEGCAWLPSVLEARLNGSLSQDHLSRLVPEGKEGGGEEHFCRGGSRRIR